MTDYTSAVETAKDLLLHAGKALSDEIRAYPTPISGCDAQFNHLLAERSKVQNALQELDKHVFVPTPRVPNPDDRVESR